MSLRALLCALPLALLLAACALVRAPERTPLGSTEAEVLAQSGQPTTRMRNEQGTRLLYTGQPWRQYAWALQFDAQGRLVGITQMLSDREFATIVPGTDTQQSIGLLFGPPAQPYTFHLTDETAYMYRYFQQGGFPAAMWVYFDTQGRVTRVGGGMDPWMVGGTDRR